MQTIKNTAIIVAAGSGQRFLSETPKQFLHISGREILSYSVETFLDHPDIGEVIIVTSPDYLARVQKDYPHCKVVAGGVTRQDSVKQGMLACIEEPKHVLIHDAARPFIPDHIIDECLKQLASFDGTAPVIKPVESMILIQNNGFKNLNRDQLRIIQTPQCFRFNILEQAHLSGFLDTDEIGLVKQALPEAQIEFIPGSTELNKITRPEDLKAITQIHQNDLKQTPIR